MGNSTPSPTPVALNFGSGVDNRSHESKVGKGFARVADNVDISVDGVVSLRDGYSLMADIPNAHSIWSHPKLPFALVADDNALWRLDPNGALTMLVDAMGGTDVHYELVADRVFWSNGVRKGTLRLDSSAPNGLRLGAWGIETPLPSFVPTATSAGGLHAGRYGVTLTYADAFHEEGGAPEPVFVDVVEGGGILISGISTPLGSAPSELRVYRTEANESTLLYAQSANVDATSLFLPAQSLGRKLTTLFKDEFPAAQYLTYKAGRIFGAVRNLLVWSDALYYGLVDNNSNFLRFPDPITMIAVPDSPRFVMYVGTTKQTYMLIGESINDASQVAIATDGCIPGSMAMVPADASEIDGVTAPVPFWVATNGLPYIGTEGGVAQAHKKFAYPLYDKAAAAFVQLDGDSRYLVAGRDRGTPSTFIASDSAIVTVHNSGSA